MLSVEVGSRAGAQGVVGVVVVMEDASRTQINAFASFLAYCPRILRLTQFALYRPEHDNKRSELPIEIIQHILTLSLPPPRFDNRNRPLFPPAALPPQLESPTIYPA